MAPQLNTQMIRALILCAPLVLGGCKKEPLQVTYGVKIEVCYDANKSPIPCDSGDVKFKRFSDTVQTCFNVSKSTWSVVDCGGLK